MIRPSILLVLLSAGCSSTTKPEKDPREQLLHWMFLLSSNGRQVDDLRKCFTEDAEFEELKGSEPFGFDEYIRRRQATVKDRARFWMWQLSTVEFHDSVAMCVVTASDYDIRRDLFFRARLRNTESGWRIEQLIQTPPPTPGRLPHRLEPVIHDLYTNLAEGKRDAVRALFLAEVTIRVTQPDKTSKNLTLEHFIDGYGGAQEFPRDISIRSIRGRTRERTLRARYQLKNPKGPGGSVLADFVLKEEKYRIQSMRVTYR